MTFKGFLSTILGMLDSIEEQVNEELNDELSKISQIPDTSQDNTNENFDISSSSGGYMHVNSINPCLSFVPAWMQGEN